jgi:hypothetical protein
MANCAAGRPFWFQLSAFSISAFARLWLWVALPGFCSLDVGSWMFDVRCWMFGFSRSLFEVRSLPPVSDTPQICVIFTQSPRVH